MADFTLPGESGYEGLTLRLAKKWGADVIRDSDGTKLSDELLNAGYDIYSTICIIREHNEWAGQHPGHLQQSFLMTPPAAATGTILDIRLMDAFFNQQFHVNEEDDSLALWQVYDRTRSTEVPRSAWAYRDGCVHIRDAIPFHRYTVNFLAWRIWEEISMYNHVTNSWDAEHLVPLDPRQAEVQAYLLQWLDDWCREHPHTNVVRFTSLFYNFAWMWGARTENRSLFTDWASYDFTVSPLAMRLFEQQYGYAITSEDFINQGKLQVTHMPPTKAKRDWMEFIQQFVLEFGKQLVDKVHEYGKKAYVFYDDSWVGLEPYGPYFQQYGFDGLIKCVFSGYEARLCAEASGVQIHELRLHPYLFPTGLGGAPTFAPGGNPTADAQRYWVNVRRALMRKPVDRIGLGGYLHLTEEYPDFVEYIAQITREFAAIKALHREGPPAALPVKVAVLHVWGKLRSWTLSGHFHETNQHNLIHVVEALSGLPVEVDFIDFGQAKKGLDGYSVVINVGRAGDAWSGGMAWADAELVAELTRWVHAGGTFIGVNEPSAANGCDTFFRMAHVLGVDMDTGAYACHGRWPIGKPEERFNQLADGFNLKPRLFLTNPETTICAARDGFPVVTQNRFGKGSGYYLSSFRYSPETSRLLLEILLGAHGSNNCICDNPYVDIAYFPKSRKAVFANSSMCEQRVAFANGEHKHDFLMRPCSMETVDITIE